MRKHFSNLACLVAAVSFVSVITSCSKQQAFAPELPEPTTVHDSIYIDGEKEYINNYAFTQDGNLYVNNQLAQENKVNTTPKVIYRPLDQHKAGQIVSSSTNRWEDSNGITFEATQTNHMLDNVTVGTAIEPVSNESTLERLHEKLSKVQFKFRNKGFMEYLRNDGKVDHQTLDFEVPEGIYFIADTAARVEFVDRETVKIEYRDSIVYKDSIVYVPQTEYVKITKNATVVSSFGFGTIDFSIGDKSFSFRMDLDSMLIHRDENGWGKATKIAADDNGFSLDDAQKGKYTVKENGIKLQNVMFVNVPFIKLNDLFQYGTATVKVMVSYEENNQNMTREFTVSGSYLHEKVIAKAEPEVVTPEITTEHVYEVDTVPSVVKDSEGHITGEKLRVTVKKDGEVWFKAQYMRWETGLLNPTITGTQVGGNNQLRATEHNWDEYKVEGWWGSEDLKGATLTAYAREFHFNTPFPKVPGFGGSEEAVAKSNIVFGTRDFYLKDAETGWELSIPAGKMDVKVIQDEVGTDEAAKAEINARGLEYEYCGTHFLSVEQYVNGKLVNTQSRNEQLLSPKN